MITSGIIRLVVTIICLRKQWDDDTYAAVPVCAKRLELMMNGGIKYVRSNLIQLKSLGVRLIKGLQWHERGERVRVYIIMEYIYKQDKRCKVKHCGKQRQCVTNRNCFLTHWGRDNMAATMADDTFKYKFVNENALISIKTSPRFLTVQLTIFHHWFR